MCRVRVAVLLVVGGFIAACPAFGQERYRGKDPNLVHFYMARQEIQILDDAPSVNDMRTQPGAATKGKVPAAPPTHPQALPRASFMPYSNSVPSMRSSLPTTFNGVPVKVPPAAPAIDPKNAKAGAYKTKKPTGSLASSAPQTMKMYSPVKGYGAGAPTAASAANSGAGSASVHVQGSLLNKGPAMLHWSRTRQN